MSETTDATRSKHSTGNLTALAMRKKGYRSLTLPDEVMEHFKREYDKNKVELFLNGISSFSGYMAAVFKVAREMGADRELLKQRQQKADQNQTKK